MNLAAIIQVVTLMEAAAQGVGQAVETIELIKRLAAEDRDPTDEEKARIDAIFDAAVERVLRA